MPGLRMREELDGGRFIIHADAPNGDGRTICGYAYEGSCFPGERDRGVTPVHRGQITCSTCLGIIRYCRDIPNRWLALR